MPDITMCANVECHKAAHCYRAQARQSEMQSYALFDYMDGCWYYIPTSAEHSGASVSSDDGAA